ncbi:MAG TPA: ABC transporter permease [Cyclobacteriaceae bacterium]|nr:ABC transporter permease [Cyclobacteriaceae bacterium]
MIKHILTTFYRTSLNARFQLATIFFGLTMGIVVSLLIYIYVRTESSFDRHHDHADRIFRLETTLDLEGKTDHTAKAALNAGHSLMEFYPEVENVTQILNVGKQTIEIKDQYFSTEKAIYADSNFFDFFTYPFIEGSQIDALQGPNKAVISKSIAKSYFGSEKAAVGHTMNVNKVDFLVTGVYDETVNQSHIPHQLFLSLSTLPKEYRDQRNREFMWLTTYSYILLKEGTDIDNFRNKLSLFNEKHLIPYASKNELNGSLTFQLEPVSAIHLNDSLRFDLAGAINPRYLSVFSAIALLTLFIALINYVNLSTAQVSRRLKEIGIKKSVGATRLSLLAQFLVETLVTIFTSYCASLVLLYLFLPELNALTDRTFNFWQVIDVRFIVTSLLFIVAFGFLAGIYPAILLSSYKPIHALQATQRVVGVTTIQRMISPGSVRKVLVTFQFGISIFLIISTIVIFWQFDHLRSQDMGFEQEQVLVIDIPSDTSISNNVEFIKNEISQVPSVTSVSTASTVPGTGYGSVTMNVSQSGGSEVKVLNSFFTDDKFIELLDIGLVTGRFFSREFSTDQREAFVINQAAAKFLGWDDPIGKRIISPFGQDGKVIGVIRDFNYKSLHTSIEPLVLMYTPTTQGYLLVKMSTNNLQSTMQQVSTTWTRFDNAHPYDYFFLDDQFQSQYIKEVRLSKIFSYFSVLGVLISCLGLIGLAIFTNELKTKEIAVRKALGASRVQILQLLSKDFLWLIVLANLIAWPASFMVVSNWLSTFAYRLDLTLLPFIYGSLIAFVIAMVTIVYFSNKASRGNIVKALKYN